MIEMYKKYAQFYPRVDATCGQYIKRNTQLIVIICTDFRIYNRTSRNMEWNTLNSMH